MTTPKKKSPQVSAPPIARPKRPLPDFLPSVWNLDLCDSRYAVYLLKEEFRELREEIIATRLELAGLNEMFKEPDAGAAA